jgi:hypothetical protein
MRRLLVFFAAAALVLVGSNWSEGGPLTQFSSSPNYKTPETISQAPASFDSFGGQFFIPDLGTTPGTIWRVPSMGGPPVQFTTTPDYTPLGGLFLPATGWGAASGNFLVTGGQSGSPGAGVIFTYAANGTRTPFVSISGPNQFDQPQIAPAGFGAFGGQLVVPNAVNGQIVAFTPAATSSVVSSVQFFPFGTAFAPPSGFGSLSGDLFVSSTQENKIAVIRPDGTSSPFTTIPLLPGQTGLRQLAFAPDEFLPGFGPLLFASVSGSTGGGGTLGDVVALDSNGAIVASLRKNLGLTKFDPRGMFFTTGGNVLINDASDAAVYLAQPADFLVVAGVPEPATFVMLVTGLAAVVALGLRRQRHAQGES